MAIAFDGRGLCRVLPAAKLDVLAEPVENTGALLPVLPVIAFWTADSQVDYSLLLVLVGVLYAGLVDRAAIVRFWRAGGPGGQRRAVVLSRSARRAAAFSRIRRCG